MRRTLYALAAFTFIAALGGCTKDEESEIRAAPTYGSIRFKNNSADLYDIFIDDNRFGSIYGGDSATYPNIVPTTHRVSARQTANIQRVATYRTATIVVLKDSVTVFYFP